MPACLSLDCVAIIAGTFSGSRDVWDLCARHDGDSPYAKTTASVQGHIDSIEIRAKTSNRGIPLA